MPNDKPEWFPLTNAPYHVTRKYGSTLARAVESLADALLRHPEAALCRCVYKPRPGESLLASTEYVRLVGETRAQALAKFRDCAGTGRIRYGSGLHVNLNELPGLCQAEGLVIPQMFDGYVRFCPAAPDTPLPADTRQTIARGLAKYSLAPDVLARLFADIEHAANRYLRSHRLAALPTKPTARRYAERLETNANALRDVLTEMQIPARGQTALHSEFRKLLREWNVDLFAFEQSLVRAAAAATELRLRVNERMAGRGQPRDKAAETLACEIANALRSAGITPTAYFAGPFENCVLPAVLAFVGAGTASHRLHELARLARLAVPDRPDE